MGIPDIAKGFRCHKDTTKFTKLQGIEKLFWGQRESNCFQRLVESKSDVIVVHDLMTDLRKWGAKDEDPFTPIEMREHLLNSARYFIDGMNHSYPSEEERKERTLAYVHLSDRHVVFPMKTATRAKRKTYRDGVSADGVERENVVVTQHTNFVEVYNALVDEDPETQSEKIMNLTYKQFKGDHSLIHLFWDFYFTTFPFDEFSQKGWAKIVDVDARSYEKRRMKKHQTWASDAEADTILFRWISLSAQRTRDTGREEKQYFIRSGDTDTIAIYALHFWDDPPPTIWEHLCFQNGKLEDDQGKFCDLQSFTNFSRWLGFSRSLFGLFVIFSGTDFFQKKWLFHGVNFSKLWNFILSIQAATDKDVREPDLLKTAHPPPDKEIATVPTKELLEFHGTREFFDSSVHTISYCALRMFYRESDLDEFEKQLRDAWENTSTGAYTSFKSRHAKQKQILGEAFQIYKQKAKGQKRFREVFWDNFAEQRRACFEAAFLNLSYWTTLENHMLAHKGIINGAATVLPLAFG